MHRRRFIALLGGALTAARSLRAQQKVIPVIGYLNATSPGPYAPNVAEFLGGLAETGWVDGQNVAIEYRWVENHNDRLPAFAADLVGRKVDVIVAGGGLVAVLAAKSATSTIPIVFPAVSDPVAAGLVASFARPGGNLTGFSPFQFELMPKRLELLTELVPQARVIALLVSPNDPRNADLVRDLQEVGRANWLQLQILEANSARELEAGIYTGRILKGEKPADLPVQQPTTFELVVNLKTATALGLTIPPSILARATEVIE